MKNGKIICLLCMMSVLFGMDRQSPLLLPISRITFETPGLTTQLVKYYLRDFRMVAPIAFMVGTCDDLSTMVEIDIKEKTIFNGIPGTEFESIPESYAGLLLFRHDFYELPYGVQKGAILQKLYAAVQFTPEYGIAPIDTTYSAPAKEAGVQALLRLNCYVCAAEFANYHPDQSSTDLTCSEGREIAKQIDPAKLCAYHKVVCRAFEKTCPTELAEIKNQIIAGVIEP